jgi:hypothetical protein
VQYGPIWTPAPSSAPAATIAVGWIIVRVGFRTIVSGMASILALFPSCHRTAAGYGAGGLRPTQSLLPDISSNPD